MSYAKQLWPIAVSVVLGMMLANGSAFAQVDRVVADAEGIT